MDREWRDPNFKMRGSEVSRLEAFSDAVFAFALTLLVVSLEVPNRYEDLLLDIRGLIPFGICYLSLVQIWNGHYRFFRLYGLDDPVTRAINTTLLFIVLAYVYPLKFLFSLALNFFVQNQELAKGIQLMTLNQAASLFVIYGVGFSALYLCFAAMYGNAIRLRTVLKLTRYELAITKIALVEVLAIATIGALSAIIAMVTKSLFWPGMTYWLIGAVKTYAGNRQRWAINTQLGQAKAEA